MFAVEEKENLAVKSPLIFFNRGNFLFWETLVTCVGKKKRRADCARHPKRTPIQAFWHTMCSVTATYLLFYTKPIRKMIRVCLKVAFFPLFLKCALLSKSEIFFPLRLAVSVWQGIVVYGQ